MDTFKATGAYDAAQGLSDLFNVCLQNDDDQEFDTRCEQPHENLLEGLGKKRLQGSEQLHTVLAMYNQEMNRDKVAPDHGYSRSLMLCTPRRRETESSSNRW